MSEGQLEGDEHALTPARVSRRTAMIAAAGGIVAAGVAVSPTVKGFSVVPAYASAASCVSASKSTFPALSTVTQAAPTTGPLCLLKCCATCWNTTGVSTICGRATCACASKTCGNPTTNKLTGQLTIPKTSPPASQIQLDYELWGPTQSTAGCTTELPYLRLAVAGIDPPFQSCTVAVAVACSAGTPVGGTNGAGGPGAPVSVIADGVVTDTSILSPVPAIPAPACTGSLQPQAPNRGAQEYCPAPATVTITLDCICR